jgi:hypothetical protein
MYQIGGGKTHTCCTEGTTTPEASGRFILLLPKCTTRTEDVSPSCGLLLLLLWLWLPEPPKGRGLLLLLLRLLLLLLLLRRTEGGPKYSRSSTCCGLRGLGLPKGSKASTSVACGACTSERTCASASTPSKDRCASWLCRCACE